ncbi:ubiquitin carboxyl-terminal hydrolase 8 [Ziziphus jujuba]|uniref:Ubiquitin carboxyl-terminal hydrolase n=1 Tax=Ziziphus jujuba TaxID=326968 RepID=A0A6P3YYD3_ZIZJJ|nr:ubiquitin carboxyl-terminal hydrolase 8 [Ziziphus jujuba]
MTRLPEKLRLYLFHKPTRLLSSKLANLSASTLHLCKSLARAFASRTLALLSMDDVFADDSDFWDFDFRSRFQRPRLLDYDDDDDVYDLDDGIAKLYLVPFRWWKEVQNAANCIEGVVYDVSSDDDADTQIVLELRKIDESGKNEFEEEGFSGREYALITEATWLQALKRHNNLNAAEKGFRRLFGAGDVLQDVFPLQIKLFVSWERNSLVVTISQKDNLIDFYKRACNIFISESEPLHIWDLSGQTSKFFVNDRISMPNDSARQMSKEILLELQVHGFLDSKNGRYMRNDDMAEEQSKDGGTLGGFTQMNGGMEYFHSTHTDYARNHSSYGGIGCLGLTGLENLGNTCFMNSAIQCLVHTPEFVDYFLGDYQREINYENPLGMKGELALAFGELLRKLWARGSRSVAPRKFKLKLAKFAPQFGGSYQHDSQEFLAFLLDGLHEDLNRVKCKPYIEVKDPAGRADEEVGEEYWHNHIARNDSIIVDVCQGQYRSTLVCPVCNKVSVTFDPFMYLSLPLPSTSVRTMSLTVISTDGITLPSTFTVTVPKCGRLKDLIEGFSTACSLGDDETILVAEIYKNRIFRVLEDPSDSLALIRDEDQLVAYRFPKESGTFPLVVFVHQQMESDGRVTLEPKIFGVPLVASLSNVSCGSDIREQYLKLLNPFLMPIGDVSDDNANDAGNYVNEASEIEDAISPAILSDPCSSSGSGDDTHSSTDFEFYIRGAIGDTLTLINMNEPVYVSGSIKRLQEVLVLWSREMLKKYDTCLLSSLPHVFKPNMFLRPQEFVSVYKCLEAFLKEEPLGPDDMWHCPSCKKPHQASKKLDLWRLPEVLVIHLKRFSYSRFFKNKLETFVDFPIEDLDLSTYITRKSSELPSRYMLYAISNHYGGMGGGHYTAFVRHDDGGWFEFDDDRVFPISEERIKTAAAYVLFYRRVPDPDV